MLARAERLLARAHPADLAPLLSDLRPEEIRTVIDMLFRHHRAATTLKELPVEMLPQIFEALGDQRLSAVISRLEIDDALEFFEWLPEERRDAVIGLLPEHKRFELRKADLYEEGSAGRVMTTSFMALDEKMTAQEAIDAIRASGEDNEGILYLYVVDGDGKLSGVVPIRRLVTAPPDRSCRDLMVLDPISVTADADQEESAQLVARYNLLAIPVTDPEGHMLGVITVDDVIEVITEEATEDMYHLAGLSDEDRVFSPASQSIRKRLPWMLVNLGTAFLAAWVVGIFEATLDRIVALAIFLPVVAGMGGNGGIQALTVITRAIALGEIQFSSGLRAMGKEVAVGSVIGAITGVASGLFAWAWRGDPTLGLVMFLAMLLTMAVAGIVGAAVPLLLKALRQDPALGSGVIVTTFTDVFGFFSFLSIGAMLLDKVE